MKEYNFPFTAILGQEKMKLGLILNVIDPNIGGVLLTGQQGTGKSTAVRSLIDILPFVHYYEDCQFSCDPNNKEFICEFCKDNNPSISESPIKLVNLPLGATAEMVIGSINVEKVIQEGKKAIEPGLLAKSHRGILYVDEINLLPDHLVDILLDVSASKINIIEREGISLKHPSNFILVGSMNPEEGELRPQISDRLGLEIEIIAPTDSTTRSEITKRVIQFNDNPEEFCILFKDEQNTLKNDIINAIKKIKTVSIPDELYEIVSQLVLKFGLKSQRADITLIRCARAHAALLKHDIIEKNDIKNALELVIGHRIQSIGEEFNAEFLGETFDSIWRKIAKDADYDNNETNVDPHHPERQQANTFRASQKKYNKYQETELPKNNYDLPEMDGTSQEHKTQKNRYSNANLDDEMKVGYKAGKNSSIRKFKIGKDLQNRISSYEEEKNMKIDLDSIIEYLNHNKKITNYAGRGNRIKIQSRSSGSHIYSLIPRDTIQKLSILDSIKSHYLYNSNSNKSRSVNSNLVVNLKKDDLKEKILEIHAPLSLYFIIDASASMKRTITQIEKIIESVHAAGYAKKDKVSIISFQGREVEILQRPSVSLSVAKRKLKMIDATSYTPLASGLDKTLKMIEQERIKGISIPVIIIMSDLGANISKKFADMNAHSDEDFMLIADELNEYAKKISKKKIKVVIMKPKKSFATRFLGVHPRSAKKIEENFAKTNAKIFEFNANKTDIIINQLKNILK